MEAALKIMEYLVVHVNKATNDKPPCVVDQSRLFFVADPDGHTVYADIIGVSNALSLLYTKIGENRVHDPNYFDRHRETLRAYFQEGLYSRQLCGVLGAPNEMLHPDLREPALGSDDGASAQGDGNSAEGVDSSGDEQECPERELGCGGAAASGPCVEDADITLDPSSGEGFGEEEVSEHEAQVAPGGLVVWGGSGSSDQGDSASESK